MAGERQPISHDEAVRRFVARLREPRHARGTTQAEPARQSHATAAYDRAAAPLGLAAWTLVKGKRYHGAHVRRPRARLGSPRAITPGAHKPARNVYNLMRYGAGYVKRTEAAHAEGGTPDETAGAVCAGPGEESAGRVTAPTVPGADEISRTPKSTAGGSGRTSSSRRPG